MASNTYFDELKVISQVEFLQAWENSEKNAKHDVDGNAYVRLEKHKQFTRLDYYTGYPTEEGLNQIIINPHNHVGNEVQPGGEPFWKIVSKYIPRVHAGQIDACLDRIYQIRQEITDLFAGSNEPEKSEYTLGHVYNDPNIAMLGCFDHGENKLYVGNYHRFVAYGVWIIENGYRPIKVFYCANRQLEIDT